MATSKKTKVTFIQTQSGVVKRVRLDGTEYDVMSAMPTLVAGQVAVTLTITNAAIDAELEGEGSNAADETAAS